MALKMAAPMLQTCTQLDLPSPQMHHASPRALSRRERATKVTGSRVCEGISQWVTLASHVGWALSSGAVYLARYCLPHLVTDTCVLAPLDRIA